MTKEVLIAPKFLVPVRPQTAVLTGHAVVFKGNRIVAVEPEALAATRWPEAERVDLPSHVLLPGFINMHTHSAMTLLRGFADDLNLRSWLQDFVWPAEARFVSADFVAVGSHIAMAEMIRCGTTCFNDFYFFPDTTAQLSCEVGMRACIGLPLIEHETPWAADIHECFDRGQSVIDRFADQELLNMAWAPHAPYSVGDAALERMGEHARRNNIAVHLHCLETPFDRKHSLREYGITPLERLDRFRILNERLIAVHMTDLSHAEMGLVKERGVSVVHCPQSNLKLASGVCAVADLLDHGVNVCIGTDGAASNNNLDLLEETRTAALLAKGVSGRAEAVGAFEALEFMTINGARALGLEESIGSIEVGKKADLCAFDLSGISTQPLYDVVSQVIYAASSEQCTDCWVGGRRLMQDRELKSMDESELLRTAHRWGETIASKRARQGH